ncbi:MAG: TonB-dependent receptor [Prevotella sp.]|nr:TonB-dependent receptor [Prevotella sp.]
MKKRFIISLCLSMMAFFAVPALAQNQTVTGTVVDETGEPIIGASVVVDGQKNIGTITDFDGNYTLSVPKNAKVVISYIGYLSQTVKPGGKIQLKEDSQSLEEVVVVGYGTQKKAHLTGSVGTVDMNDVQDLSGANLSSALDGLVNGLSISGGDGRVNGTPTVRIRDTQFNAELGDVGLTQRSISPLYVIDGYVYPNDVKVGNDDGKNPGEEAFNNLDPNEVESISVLKDASAAVYGSRAANGVILVTTKKGKQGKPRISYSGTFGLANAVGGRPDMLNAYEYGRLYNAVAAADPITVNSSSFNRKTSLFQADELEAMKNLNYDLLDKYWKTAFTTQHSINVSGATDNVSYFAGIGYFKQDGNLGKLDYDRWNYRAGVDVKISNSLKANLTVSGNYGSKNTPNISIGSAGGENDYRSLLYRPTYIPEYVYDYPIFSYGPSNGSVNDVQRYHYDLMQNNGDFSETKTSDMTINGSLEYNFDWSKIFKGLRLRFSYSKNISTDKNNQYGSDFTIYKMVNRTGSGNHLYTAVAGENYDDYLYDANFEGQTYSNGSKSYLMRSMSRSDNYQMNFTAQYQRKFGKHDVSALFSIEKSETETEWMRAQEAYPYSFTNHQSNGASGTKEYAPQWTRYEAGTLSYIGRINYAYADRYLFEFLIRSDASTKFAPKNYWGTFPSFSAGWVASEEPWFEKTKWLKWIDFLKLRASFGLTGRDNTAAWQWMQTYDLFAKPGAVFGTSEGGRSQVVRLNNDNADVNTDLHWDKSYKLNIGLDLHTLNRRLAFSYEFYYTWNRDMFMNLSQEVPGTVGALSAYTNLGEVNAWGHEFSVTWRDKIGKDFKYKITLNTGYSDNKVLKADFATDYIYRTVQAGMRSDIGTWGMQCIGMFRSFQDIYEYVEKNNITSYLGMRPDQIRPGMLIYKDVRGKQLGDGTYAGPDGVVDRNDDQVCLSSRNNPYGFTVNANAEWKGISLTAQFRSSWGGYSFIPSQALNPYYGLEATNMPSIWNVDNMYSYQDVYDDSGNLVVQKNTEGYYPNLAYASVNSIQSNFWRVSGTTIRLSRLTLAYTFPAKWFKSIGIQGVRVNVTGTNLINFYNPYPDHFASNWSGYGSYPTLRKWTVGLNVSF